MVDRYPEIDEVIRYIHQHLYESLPLSRLAKYAGYSVYHFTRIFKERTGLSPLYYVSSVRLQKAKDLLLHTNLTVRDIGLEIGQQSLGTFTTRFAEKVGMTPSRFRSSISQADHYIRSLQQLNGWPELRSAAPSAATATIKGTVKSSVNFSGIILIGLFAKPIPEGLPLYGTLLPTLGDFCFTSVQPGQYYLMATSLHWNMPASEILLPDTTLRFRKKEPIIVEAFTPVSHQQVTLRPPSLEDPPILVSLPVLMNQFLSQIQKQRN